MHLKDVWEPLRNQWKAKFASDSAPTRAGDENEDFAETGFTLTRTTAVSKHSRDEDRSDKENGAESTEKRQRLSYADLNYEDTLFPTRSERRESEEPPVLRVTDPFIKLLEEENAKLRAELQGHEGAMADERYITILERENLKLQKELYAPKPKPKPVGPDVRWYGVQGGGRPGVYTNYAEVSKTVQGVGGRQQRFPTREEAQSFVDGKDGRMATGST